MESDSPHGFRILETQQSLKNHRAVSSQAELLFFQIPSLPSWDALLLRYCFLAAPSHLYLWPRFYPRSLPSLPYPTAGNNLSSQAHRALYTHLIILVRKSCIIMTYLSCVPGREHSRMALRILTLRCTYLHNPFSWGWGGLVILLR